MDRMDYKITRCHGIVPECFKDDNASQWKSGKFDPRSLSNCTDRHQICMGDYVGDPYPYAF